jgi:hypothetical protein
MEWKIPLHKNKIGMSRPGGDALFWRDSSVASGLGPLLILLCGFEYKLVLSMLQ